MSTCDQTLKHVTTLPLLLILCLLTAGCQRSVPVRDNPTAKPDATKPIASSGLDTDRAGTSLRLNAKTETDAGQFQRASRLLERALRIDSRDPATYYEFARLRCLEASPDRAVQLMEKGLTLNPDTALRSLFRTLKKECPGMGSELESGPEPAIN